MHLRHIKKRLCLPRRDSKDTLTSSFVARVRRGGKGPTGGQGSCRQTHLQEWRRAPLQQRVTTPGSVTARWKGAQHSSVPGSLRKKKTNVCSTLTVPESQVEVDHFVFKSSSFLVCPSLCPGLTSGVQTPPPLNLCSCQESEVIFGQD